MPELTQQQWFKETLDAWTLTYPSTEIRWGIRDMPLDAYLAAAWPSSPQGLAAKALVEALKNISECSDIRGARVFAQAALKGEAHG